MKDIIPYLAPITTLIGGWFLGKRKNSAEATLTEVEAVERATTIWRTLAEDMTKKVDELRKLVDELKVENYKLQQEINELKQRG
jgi:peptidoglycan hydrolase CwlO-like protein